MTIRRGPTCPHTWAGHRCARSGLYGPHTHACICGATTLSPHGYEPAPGALGALCWCGHGPGDRLHQEATAA